MEDLEVQSGTFVILPDGSLQMEQNNPSATAGEDTDANYQLFTTINAVSGDQVGIILLGTNCLLDFKNNQLSIGTYANKAYNLSHGTAYDVRGVAKGNVIQLFINGVCALKATTSYGVGLHGVVGLSNGVSANFKNYFFQPANQYVNLAEVLSQIQVIDYKDLVGKNGTYQDYLDFVFALIDEACRFIDSETQRPEGAFQAGGLETTDTFDGTDYNPPAGMFELQEETEDYNLRSSTFFLRNTPVLNIIQAQENLAQIGDTDNWIVKPAGSYRNDNNKIIFSANATPKSGSRNVQITYTAGYAVTPAAIKRAVVRLINNYIHKQIAERTGAFLAFSKPQGVNFVAPDVLTSDIKLILTRYTLGAFGEF